MCALDNPSYFTKILELITDCQFSHRYTAPLTTVLRSAFPRGCHPKKAGVEQAELASAFPPAEFSSGAWQRPAAHTR